MRQLVVGAAAVSPLTFEKAVQRCNNPNLVAKRGCYLLFAEVTLHKSCG